jgi:hypothetical protein
MIDLRKRISKAFHNLDLLSGRKVIGMDILILTYYPVFIEMTLEGAFMIPLSCLGSNLFEPRCINNVNLLTIWNLEKTLLSTPTISEWRNSAKALLVFEGEKTTANTEDRLLPIYGHSKFYFFGCKTMAESHTHCI